MSTPPPAPNYAAIQRKMRAWAANGQIAHFGQRTVATIIARALWLESRVHTRDALRGDLEEARSRVTALEEALRAIFDMRVEDKPRWINWAKLRARQALAMPEGVAPPGEEEE